MTESEAWELVAEVLDPDQYYFLCDILLHAPAMRGLTWEADGGTPWNHGLTPLGQRMKQRIHDHIGERWSAYSDDDDEELVPVSNIEGRRLAALWLGLEAAEER